MLLERPHYRELLSLALFEYTLVPLIFDFVFLHFSLFSICQLNGVSLFPQIKKSHFEWLYKPVNID